jgi:replicative DNA helicase
MSDTRGSGAVEERATSLVLLHRDWITEETEQYGRKQRIATCKLETGMFLVAKNADGEADKSICMRVDGAAMMIVEQMRAAA